VPSIAERSICIVGNFIRVAHKKYGVHILSVCTRSYR
jgi:hypothetical protein